MRCGCARTRTSFSSITMYNAVGRGTLEPEHEWSMPEQVAE